MLVSGFAIEGKPNTITYRDASRFWRSGLKADGFSAKGAIHVRLRIADRPPAYMDCILTHLESHSTEARQNQIQELAGFIATHSSPQRPLVVLGDLNVTADHPISSNATDSEYGRMIYTLRQGNRPLIDVWPTLSAGRGGTSDALAGESSERIDYVLMSSPSILTPTIIKIIPFLDKQVDQGSLSDHAGVACSATLNLR